jgi:hypothetical protein
MCLGVSSSTFAAGVPPSPSPSADRLLRFSADGGGEGRRRGAVEMGCGLLTILLFATSCPSSSNPLSRLLPPPTAAEKTTGLSRPAPPPSSEGDVDVPPPPPASSPSSSSSSRLSSSRDSFTWSTHAADDDAGLQFAALISSSLAPSLSIGPPFLPPPPVAGAVGSVAVRTVASRRRAERWYGRNALTMPARVRDRASSPS